MSKAQSTKCVIVIDRELPVGLVANSAAVLAAALTRLDPTRIGDDLRDASGGVHRGIVTLPIVILAARRDELRELAGAARAHPELQLVDFTDVAQTSTSYGEYCSKLATRPTDELGYLAVLLYGERALVGRLTSRFSLLR